MSDRELLEMAAKAAGIVIQFPYTHGVKDLDVSPRRTDTWDNWNPLTDDGDALRLAVQLNIQITPGTYNPDEFTAFKAAGGEAHEFRHFQQDAYAATRRAIVRAAVEIGRAMS
jgi:hypothetical protein